MIRFLLLLLLCTSAAPLLTQGTRKPPEKVAFTQEEIATSHKIAHVIVIMQENWSFDSLYGKFPGAEGIAQASPESMRQLDRNGTPFSFLPPCSYGKGKKTCPDIPARLPNAPFDLEPYISLTKNTVDPVHRFYNELCQINGGKMNGFAAWGNTGGFVMSYYDISKTRMGQLAKQYTLCDHFFHSCYGSSMCGALMLFSAQIPKWPNPPQKLIIDTTEEGIMSFKGKVTKEGYAVEDFQPYYPPYRKNTPPNERLPPQTFLTIGDLLDAKKISWGWYAEGWDDALAGKDSHDFPCHHQAPSYFPQFAPNTAGRKAHLFDLREFHLQLQRNELPAVCFIRSLDSHSEHPGEGSLLEGLNWCADLIETIQKSPAWDTCVIVVTYDENGGRWDHVAPPIVDAFGPGTRIPTLIISPFAKKGFVDKTTYETVSILKFIEERWGLPSLSPRDANANNLLNAFDFSKE